MTDRELLELAAKAAGYNIEEWQGNYAVVNGSNWHPLSDSGNALDLAVKLEINILPSMEECSARNPSYTGWMNEACKTDPYDATRRAIVRAAAEIGKTMP